MTRLIYLWTRWNSSVISCSEIVCIFPSLPLSINSFFFSLISILGTHAIRFCILSVSFTIYFETFYFIRHNSADSIPTSNKHRSPDPECAEWVSFLIRLFSNLIGSGSSIDEHRHTLGIGQVVTIGKIILSSFLFISSKLK